MVKVLSLPVPTWSPTTPFDLEDINSWPPQMFVAYCRVRGGMMVSDGMNYDAITIPEDGGVTTRVLEHMQNHGPFDTNTGVGIAGTYIENALRDAPLDFVRLILFYDQVLSRSLDGAPHIGPRLAYIKRLLDRYHPGTESSLQERDLTMVTRRALGLQSALPLRVGGLY